MDDAEEPAAYAPDTGFEEDSRETLFDLSSINSDSAELWLIQWPHNELPDFQGKEISLNLYTDGCVTSFEGSSGKVYNVVSCAAQEPEASVFLSTASETKIVGNVSRRVSIVHFPDPKELEKQEAEKKSKRMNQMAGGSALHSATKTPSSKLRSTVSTHSGRYRSSLSEAGEPSSSKRMRKRKHERGVSTDRSTLDSGRSRIN